VAVPILKHGPYLIASIQSALSDSEVLELRDDLTERVGESRARGVIVDVAAMDVIDSFVARSLQSIALTAQLRGAKTVIVGIRPDVAVAMVQFKLNLEPLHTALDLEEGLALLNESLDDGGRCGLEVVARDDGPGISDVDAALRDGYASRGGLGLGLPGARRLMDEFDVVSRRGEGTTVTMRKWRERDALERSQELRGQHE